MVKQAFRFNEQLKKYTWEVGVLKMMWKRAREQLGGGGCVVGRVCAVLRVKSSDSR